MGCNVSKLGPGEDASGLRPARRKLIDEILGGMGRRRTTGRKDSIVSTTELLVASEDVEEEDSLHKKEAAVKDERKVEGREEKAKEDHDEKKEEKVEQQNHQEEEIKQEKIGNDNNIEEEKGDKRQKEGDVDVAVDDNKRRLTHYDDDDDDDLVGSPSFRIYFVDDSSKTEDQGKEEHAQLGSVSEKDSFGSKDDNNDLPNEGSEARGGKKARGRRLRALAAKPITYGLRSCYHHGISVTPDGRSTFSTSSASKPTPPTSTH